MKRIALFFGILVLLLGALLGFGLRKKSHVPGGTSQVEGIQIDVAAKIAARITHVHVAKGDLVKKGARLITLDCTEPQAMAEEAAARLRAAKAQSQGAALLAESAQGQRRIALAARKVSLAQAASLSSQRDATQRNAERLEALESDVALSQRDQTRSSALALEHQVKATEAQAQVNQVQASTAYAGWRASHTQTQAAEESVQALEAVLRRAQHGVTECTLTAPRDGWIAEIPFEVGELLFPGSVGISLLDLHEIRATFYLPNAELALAKPNGAVEARADAYPGEAFRGRILNVAHRAEFTPRNIVTWEDRHHLVYPIEVALPNPDGKLRVGMPVEIVMLGAGHP